ncbi:hypothetical protein E1A91_A05G361500v1 [Gossypium mustelinum]|uniref:NB-ARC domain-containing protein n=1 Tax=Gossypium mustelinum TaxID=34275 RepID=A0A5D2ZGC5_GOSMU|nr:hypothetical protein E1A91_A05G361500v1 [Gossypium mustelinum]
MVAREPFLTGLLQFLLNSLASIKNLVSDLRYLLYDMEDTVDEFSTEYLRCKLMAQRQAISNMVHDQVPRKKKPLNSCFPTELCVYGKDTNKKKILELMTRDGSSDDDFSIIPIIGMDGVGKTTFTHLIYNDGACKGFDPKVWVDQSYDDLDVANETLLNMRKWYFKEYQLNAQLTLRKEFSQKRFFLLNPLIDDDFWSLFVDYALPNTDFDTSSPLETMVIGGLLNFEERNEWENILNGNLWSLHDEEDADIVPVLRLSYHYLPSHLKLCFASYSILKKYEFEKIELILLWMCNGKHSKESSNARHLSYFHGKYDNQERIEQLYNAPCLGEYYLTTKALDLLSKLRCLRVLYLSGYYIRFLPESIRDLKLLRHLNLSFTKIRNLPELTTNKCNLQALILKICFYLKKWPANMYNLTNLQYLDITNVNSLEKMTVGMKELKTLHMLPQFVVENNVGSGIRDLKELKLFQQSFNINRLERVVNSQEASNAELKYMNVFEYVVLEKLQPCTKLRKLTIAYYGGTKFPTWLGESSFSHMVHLDLDNCQRCITLPPLGQLPSLKDLCIRSLYAVKSLDLEFFKDAVLEPFPALDLKDWEFPLDVNAMFHRLCKLNITSCPELAGKLPSYLPSLDKLVLYRCQQLVVSILSLPMLNARPGGTFKHFKLTCLTEGFMQGLTEDLLSLGSLNFVRYLEITNGLPLIFLGEEVKAKETAQLDIPFTVECLTFHLSLQKFQKAFSSLYNLRELYFTRYHGRVLMRESNLPSSLKILEIKDCFELQCALDEEENVNDNIRNTGLLEELTIKSCLLLTCLFARGELPSIPHHFTLHNTGNCDMLGKLPSALKHIDISICPKLKSVAKRFQKDSSLEYISIFDCANLKSLPECLYNLSNLKIFYVGSLRTFLFFPEGGFPALPNCFHKLASLRRLFIAGYPNIISFPEEGLPPNLTSLKLKGTNICKPVFKWGVHKLSSLEELTVCRSNYISYYYLIPLSSLVTLKTLLVHMDKLTYQLNQPIKTSTSKGFRHLNSLASLIISDYPKLTSLLKDGLPPSLLVVHISQCPLLEQHCTRNKGLERFKIAQVPRVDIGHRFIIHDQERD